MAEEVVGAAKGEAGRLTGDVELRVDGKIEELTGKARKARNK